MEAIYPHRSAIPSRSSVSPIVEAESFDDCKTPVIRLTPVEEELEFAEESSYLVKLETKPPGSTQEPVSGLNLATSAALTELMKTKELGSMIEPDLGAPKKIKNLSANTTGKSLETQNQQVENMATKPQPRRIIVPQRQFFEVMKRQAQPTPKRSPVSPPNPGVLSQHLPIRHPSSSLPMNLNLQRPQTQTQNQRVETNINPTLQHVIVPAMATKQQTQPIIIPQRRSFLISQPFAIPEQRRVSQPKSAIEQHFPIRHPSTSLPMNQHVFSKLVNPQVQAQAQAQRQAQAQAQANSAFRISAMNNVQTSTGYGRNPQTGLNTYPMNLNRADTRPKPGTKTKDYFKNLIRQHGTVNPKTNKNHSQTGKSNGCIDQIKVQKKCKYFNTAQGCKLGDNCTYLHDRVRPSSDSEAPKAKRLKVGKSERNGNYCDLDSFKFTN